jgi:hypothetical protein
VFIGTNLAFVSNGQACAKIWKPPNVTVARLYHSFVKKLRNSLVNIKPQWREAQKGLTSIICHRNNLREQEIYDEKREGTDLAHPIIVNNVISNLQFVAWIRLV